MKRRRQLTKGNPIPHLINRTELRVRFNEVDSLRYVWHGHYVKYFEDGREAFGRQFDLGYMQMYEHGFATPLIRVEVDYKQPLFYGDEAIVETQYVDSAAAKIIFQFKIFRKSTMELVAEGKTVQIFTNKDGELELTMPAFFKEWKQQKISNSGFQPEQ